MVLDQNLWCSTQSESRHTQTPRRVAALLKPIDDAIVHIATEKGSAESDTPANVWSLSEPVALAARSSLF